MSVLINFFFLLFLVLFMLLALRAQSGGLVFREVGVVGVGKERSFPKRLAGVVGVGEERSFPKWLTLGSLVTSAGVGSLDVMLDVTASQSRYNLHILGNNGGGRWCTWFHRSG